MFDLAPGLSARGLVSLEELAEVLPASEGVDHLVNNALPSQLHLPKEPDLEVPTERLTFGASGLLANPELQRLTIPNFAMAPGRLYALHDVFVHAGAWIVMREDGMVLRETIPGWQRDRVPDVLALNYNADRSIRGVTEHIEEPVCMFQNMTFWNYSHWHYDCLSSIMMLEGAAPSRFRYLLGPHMRQMSFFASSLPLFEGFTRGFHDVDGVIHCRTLLLSSRSFVSVDPCRHLLQMFDHVEAQVPSDRAARRRLYVARFDAAERRGLINEADLAEALERRGFEVIVPGRLSYVEQVRLFSEASYIIGPHGAGLANIGFAPADATLVEIHPSDYGVPTFLRLGLAKGMRVHCYLVEPETGAGHSSQARIDIQNFLSALESWGIR